MRAVFVLLMAPVWGLAQPDIASRGSEIFAVNCATGYCHGSKGASGGAPRLASRGLDAQFIRRTVTEGHGSMPAFGDKLAPAELNAVIAYVGELNGIPLNAMMGGRGGRGGPAPGTLPADAVKGRALFFEATRSFGRCSTCHQVDGNGIPVTDPIVHVPENAAALRALSTPHVRTASIGSESFPVVVVKNTGGETMVYDLTSPPPVRRSFWNGEAKIADGSSWRHSSVTQSYSDPELDSILIFLRAVVKP